MALRSFLGDGCSTQRPHGRTVREGDPLGETREPARTDAPRAQNCSNDPAADVGHARATTDADGRVAPAAFVQQHVPVERFDDHRGGIPPPSRRTSRGRSASTSNFGGNRHGLRRFYAYGISNINDAAADVDIKTGGFRWRGLHRARRRTVAGTSRVRRSPTTRCRR
jgi:hypothetical protein